MATAALLMATATTGTIALSPHHFTGLRKAVGAGTCPTCAPSTIVVPVSLRPSSCGKKDRGSR